ncbi:MAG: TetR/AcrR family transcriptional regulator [Polaromonas sp.]|uniref:TetR/AcrR family transcriptional regulator n=1 Tax=Polaromonas sp. TaxID=1869339 RepID=UPI0017EB77F5|nr:TetR/AcrR family transcriptional regulator [Polaromonas sp.]NMM09281.1 TetR/AcrR family transcriptional regulator [Polaromonas sp.]
MSTRDDLVQTCTQMIAENGLAAFSLRKVADRVGIKAPSIYEHFESKEALLGEARRAATVALNASMVAHCKGLDPRQRLLTTAMGYLQFAQEQPSLFALLFMETPSKRRSLAELPEQNSPYAFLLARVNDFLVTMHSEGEVLSFGIWSLVHGAAVLRHTHLKEFSAPVLTSTRKNLEALLDGWKTQPAQV